uniref:RING-type domain-containing protein n=1 Tax=Oryza rufipogon TaxID=4529 RepID=A0A0E0PAT4_ORYRU
MELIGWHLPEPPSSTVRSVIDGGGAHHPRLISSQVGQPARPTSPSPLPPRHRHRHIPKAEAVQGERQSPRHGSMELSASALGFGLCLDPHPVGGVRRRLRRGGGRHTSRSDCRRRLGYVPRPAHFPVSGVGGGLRGFLHRAPPGSARNDKGCARRHKTASSSATSAEPMDEGEADLLQFLFVTSGVSWGGIVGVVVAVNASVPAARVWMLPGVTTLDRELGGDDCSMCQYDKDAGAVVRTLSCDHVFHKACIDVWLREHGMACRLCRRTASCVLPWKTGGRRRHG